jgi:hypothetical protein
MARYFRLFVLVLSGALIVAERSTRAEPLLKVVDHAIVSTTPLDMDEIRRRMVLAATRRGWAIQDEGGQRLIARIGTDSGRYEAVVGISYTDRAYSLTLLESKGFSQRGDTINSRANRWIRNLEQDIARAFLRPPAPVAAPSANSVSRPIVSTPKEVPPQSNWSTSGAFPPVQSSGSR